jgi:hypothetical protein
LAVQDRLVEEVHPVVPQAVAPSLILLVTAVYPKFKPFTVSWACPEAGEFGETSVMTGASKVKLPTSVPDSAAIVNFIVISFPAPCVGVHVVTVDEVHTLVAQRTEPSLTVGVGSAGAMLVPKIVITAALPLEVAVFGDCS